MIRLHGKSAGVFLVNPLLTFLLSFLLPFSLPLFLRHALQKLLDADRQFLHKLETMQLRRKYLSSRTPRCGVLLSRVAMPNAAKCSNSKVRSIDITILCELLVFGSALIALIVLIDNIFNAPIDLI